MTLRRALAFAAAFSVTIASAQPVAGDPTLVPLPAGEWELGLDLGTGSVDWHLLFVGYEPKPDLRLSVHAEVALDERLELRLPIPELALHLGDPQRLSGVIHGGVQALSFLDEQFTYQLPQDAIAIVPPMRGTQVLPRATLGAGGSLLLQRGPLRWSLSGELGETVAFGSRAAALPNAAAAVTAGVSIPWGDRVTLHLAVGVVNSAAIIPGLVSSSAMLALGNVERIGLRRPPLVRVRIAPRLFLDADAGLWIGVNGLAEVRAGFTWMP